jgi:hypothetical protein
MTMQSPSIVSRQAITSPSVDPPLNHVDLVASAPVMPAANDDTISGPSEYRPNPLWAVNVAMAAFFFFAAMLIASG